MKFLFIVFMLILNLNSYAQNWLKVDSVFAVSGVTVKSFSAPAFGDLNNDGTYDLFLGNITDVTDFFWNNSTNFPSTYSKDTSLLWNIYSGGLINTNSDYPALVDLDNDSDLDLIIGGYYGLLYYENIGTITEPEFVENDTVFTLVNAQIGGDPKPAFADLDGDGDFDLLVGIGESFVPGPEPGLTIGFRNNGTAVLPVFELDNTLVAGIPDAGLNSYPALADLDNDGDYDLLLGRDGGALRYYKNEGTVNEPVWTQNNNTFASVETQTYWKNPTFVDLDYDGDLDLVYGQSTGILYVYRNNGTVSNPLFQFYPDYFKIIKLDGSGGTAFLADFDDDGDYDMLSGMWDGKFYYFRNDGTNQTPVFNRVTTSFSSLTVNSYSSPVFVDIDGDGDLDIVAGSLYGEIKCYVNNNGTFTLDNSIFGFIDVGWMSVPTFADLDGDGDLDLLVGAETGSEYRYYENKGNNVFEENSTTFAGITFPSYSRPTLADIDNDGDYDLIIGRSNGVINYYRNDGDETSPVWVRADSEFEGVKVKQNAHAGFADLDGDGRKDMVVAEYDGNFTFYKNLFVPVIPVELISFTASAIENKIKLSWSTATELNNRGFEIERKSSVSNFEIVGFIPGFGTTTDTKVYSFIDQNISIGLYTYRLKQIDFDGTYTLSSEVLIEVNPPLEFILAQNYPNPFNPTTKIIYHIPSSGRGQAISVKLNVFDVLGNELATLVNEEQTSGVYEVEFDGTRFSSGIYFYKLQSGASVQIKKMTLIK